MKTKLFGLIASVAMFGASFVGPANATTFNVNGVFNSAQFRVTTTIEEFVNPPPFMNGAGPLAGAGNTLTGTVTINGGVLTGVNLSLGIFANFGLAQSSLSNVSADGLSWSLTASSGGFTPTPLNLTDTNGMLTFGSFTFAEQGPHSWDTQVVNYSDLTGTVTPPIPTPIPTALPLFATGLGALGLLGWRRKRKAAASVIKAHLVSEETTDRLSLMKVCNLASR